MLNVKSKYLCPAPTPAGGFEVAVFNSTFFKRKSFGMSIFVSNTLLLFPVPCTIWNDFSIPLLLGLTSSKSIVNSSSASSVV